MKFRIGFSAEPQEDKYVSAPAYGGNKESIIPRKSLVQVRFQDCGREFAYYNDLFDLHRGDLVYVDGKLEGQLGRVTEVNYNFRIRLSDYKRVIARVDTNVSGEFHMAGSYFISFDRTALPAKQALSWFMAPGKDDEEYISGSDDSAFSLDTLKGFDIDSARAERGRDYYYSNKVRYLSLDGSRGTAIVEGTRPYELEFDHRDGYISAFTCGCFCSGACKHEFAVLLQLRETLGMIEKNYKRQYENSGYFAAVAKETLFAFAIAGKDSGSLRL